MKCNRCGRDLAEGQTYCLCGQNVSALTGAVYYSDANGGDATVRQKPPLTVILLIVIAVTIGLVGMTFFGSRDRWYVTHENKWEPVRIGNCEITIPSNMKDGQFTMETSEMTLLGYKSNKDVGVGIMVLRFTEEQQKLLKKVDMMSLLKDFFPTQTVNGVKVEPKQRGNMLYFEAPEKDSALNNVMILDACFLRDDAIYEVEIHCKESKFDSYRLYMLDWLDSFKVIE